MFELSKIVLCIDILCRTLLLVMDVSALMMSWMLKLTCQNNVMMLSMKFTKGSSFRPVCGPEDSLKDTVMLVRVNSATGINLHV